MHCSGGIGSEGEAGFGDELAVGGYGGADGSQQISDDSAVYTYADGTKLRVAGKRRAAAGKADRDRRMYKPEQGHGVKYFLIG